MKTGATILFYSVCLSLLLPITACNQNKTTADTTKKTASAKNNKPVSADEAMASGTITAPDYEVKIYGAFAFVPTESSLISPEKGHHYVVLDMSVENTSGWRSVDIGQILLSAQVTDEKGTLYPRSTLAIQAFEREYPEENHKSEYRATKGKIRPGRYYRTTAYGFEAPVNVNTFFIAMNEDGNPAGELKVRRAKFVIE